MNKSLEIKAYAKVNLSLDVMGKRDDGYHDLKMIMQTVDLCDTLILTVTDSRCYQLSTDLSFLPTNDDNIAIKAAKIYYEFSKIPFTGFNIKLCKKIPVCAGLGGGSADAAAVILGLNRLYGTQISFETLAKWGLKAGADVPYCMAKQTALVEGVGEKITLLSPLPDCFFVIIKPSLNISTRSIFEKLNLSKVKHHPDTSGMIDAITCGDLNSLSKRMYNVLESVTAVEYGVIGEIKGALLDCGAMGSVMSGSGSAVFGLFESENTAQKAYEVLQKRYPDVYLCKPYFEAFE